jgi:hypothetical protein
MAQPQQMLSGLPAGEFSVIDNSPAGNGGVAGGIGYDTTAPGAIAQGTNAFGGSGTIPDAANTPKYTVTAFVGVNNSTVKFKSPA